MHTRVAQFTSMRTCSHIHACRNASLCNATFSPLEVPRAVIAPFFCALSRSVCVCVFEFRGCLGVLSTLDVSGQETHADKKDRGRVFYLLSQ